MEIEKACCSPILAYHETKKYWEDKNAEFIMTWTINLKYILWNGGLEDVFLFFCAPS